MLRSAPQPSLIPAPAVPLGSGVRERATSMKHDAYRPRKLWNNAVSATKGLFHQPARPVPVASASVPLEAERRKVARRSVSVPALKAKASASRLRQPAASSANAQARASPFPSHSSPRRPKNAHGRPVISKPSLPQHLDSHNIPSHSKLAYPLPSPVPSSTGPTFQYKSAFIQSSSKLSTNLSISEDESTRMTSADAVGYLDPVPARRRTKSAPGVRFGQLQQFSPDLPDTREADSGECISPVVIDISSPSTVSLPSPTLETPKLGADDYLQNVTQPFSPRSLVSVKRKPVPQYLYTESPENNSSAPSTPQLTPDIGTSPLPSTSSDTQRPLQTPLLPEAELILKQCRSNKRDLTLLPIGQSRSLSATRAQRRGSLSEHSGSVMDSQPSTPISSVSNQWISGDSHGSLPPASASKFGLPAPPRVPSPPRTPLPEVLERSVFSDDTDDVSSSTHSRALSPLTDEEIRAIRNFIHRHANGHRARQRRRNSFGKCTSDQHCSRSASISTSYDMHAKILDSYLVEESSPNVLGESEDDGDADSHMPMSGSEAEADTITVSSFGNFGPLEDSETDTLDQCNRGTFGYYDVPMTRNRRYRRDLRGIYAYEYIPSDSENEGAVGTSAWMNRDSSDFGDFSDAMDSDSFSKHEDKENIENIYSGTPLCLPAAARPCSSLYYRSSSDYTPHDDEHLVGLRSSREPLVPCVLNSDSESDRPLSSSSASMSIAGSTSSITAAASGIGLAIIPPEQFAYFDTFACSPPRYTNAFEDSCTDDSPATLPRASPERRARKSNSAEANNTDLSVLSERLQTRLVKAEMNSSTRSFGSKYGSSSPLKPALQIKAFPASIVPNALPSPADSVSTYPPASRSATRLGGKKAISDAQGVSYSADEASVRCDENAVPSFMHLTPDAPTPKKRLRLKSLFSRKH